MKIKRIPVSLLFLTALFAFSHFVKSYSLQDISASNNGVINLYATDFGGYYANVDLQKKNTPSADINDIPSTVPMIPVLYSSDTMLAAKCFNFSSYNCDDYDCKLFNNSPISINYLNFQVQGYLAKAPIYLDYNNWSLYPFAILANSCSSESLAIYGSNTYGILGLGATPMSDHNYIGSKEFSIDLDTNGKQGKIVFGKNSLYNDEDAVEVMYTDKDWKIRDNEIVVIGEMPFFFEGLSLLFDFNKNVIGLPAKVFAPLISAFGRFFNLKCNSANYMPICTWNDQIKNLPLIEFGSDFAWVPIPPQVYVLNGWNDSAFMENVTLNIHSTSSTSEGDSYVLPEYDNHIIIGNSFMKYYHVKFDVENTAMFVFKRKDNEDPSFPYLWIYCLVGALVLCVGVGVTVKCLKSQKEVKKESNGRSSNNHESSNSLLQ